MRLLKLTLILLLSIGFLLLLGSFFISPKFELSKSRAIKAAHARVIHHLVDIKKWPNWWPWNGADQHFSVEGPISGEGAALSWSKRPAPGRLVITRSNIYAIEFDVFLDGKSAPLKSALEIQPFPDGTSVTWRVRGEFETPILGPYLAVLAESMHAGMLSWGLRSLADQVEKDTSQLEMIYSEESGKDVIEQVP